MRTISAEGMIVVITGASRGIGRATARHFAARGASVVLAARSEGALLGLATECEALGGRALAVPTDVAEWGSVEELARRSVEHFGRIDVWVNNAVLAAVGRLEEVSPEANRRVVEANLLGYVNGAQAALPHFREQGSGVLINMSSGFGLALRGRLHGHEVRPAWPRPGPTGRAPRHRYPRVHHYAGRRGHPRLPASRELLRVGGRTEGIPCESGEDRPRRRTVRRESAS